MLPAENQAGFGRALASVLVSQALAAVLQALAAVGLSTSSHNKAAVRLCAKAVGTLFAVYNVVLQAVDMCTAHFLLLVCST